MAFPPNPPVAMYGQYVVTGEKSYSEFHQWQSVDPWPPMENLWPLVENPWPPVEIDNFRSDNLVCGAFKCQKWNENYMQFSGKFCYNVLRKTITH